VIAFRELRRLQEQALADRQRAVESAAAVKAAVLVARSEGRPQRWIADALGVTYGRVQAIEREAKRVAQS
jgi:transcriptional regulator